MVRRGIITTKKAVGDVHFLNVKGEAVLPVSKNVSVTVTEDFYGTTLRDAVESAQQYASGAIKHKVEQKMRGYDCIPIVRNIRISYQIKQGFTRREAYERLLRYNQGECILKRGERGTEFFLVKDGIVDISGIEYKSGSIFGRAAFSDGIRKMDVFAKTPVTLIAIDKKHPELKTKLPVLVHKFAEEIKNIKKIRPKAEVDSVVFR